MTWISQTFRCITTHIHLAKPKIIIQIKILTKITIWHTVFWWPVLVLFLKLFNPFLQKSTRHYPTLGHQFRHLDYNPDRAQKLISSSMSRHLSTRNISSKSMHAFLSNLANRQTDKRTRANAFTVYLLLCINTLFIRINGPSVYN